MTQQTPLNVTVPTISDTPDVPRDTLEIVSDLEPMLIPRFSTDAQRDTAKATRDFRECWSAGVRQIWNAASSSWVPWPGTWYTRGPGSITDYTGTSTVVCTMTVPQVQGRRYRIEAAFVGQQINASGQPTVYIATGVTVGSLIAICVEGSRTYAAGDRVGAPGATVVTASSTGNATYNLLAAQSAGALRIGTNAAYILATDIGPS